MKYLLFALLALCPACATMQELGAIGTHSAEPPPTIATNPPDERIQDLALKRADWERRHQRAMNDYSVPEEDYYVKPTWDPETGALTQMIYGPNRYAGDNKPEYGYRIINGRLAPNSDVNNRGPFLSPEQREEINADLAGSHGYVNELQLNVQANEQQLKVQAKSYISGRQKRKAEPKNTGQKSKRSANTGSVHYICVPKCYVRQTPDTNSPAVAELLEFDWVRVLKTRSSWCQVETGAGSVGWLSQNMIK
jgi:hypothetical protein